MKASIRLVHTQAKLPGRQQEEIVKGAPSLYGAPPAPYPGLQPDVLLSNHSYTELYATHLCAPVDMQM
jgi:hypothetical protein